MMWCFEANHPRGHGRRQIYVYAARDITPKSMQSNRVDRLCDIFSSIDKCARFSRDFPLVTFIRCSNEKLSCRKWNFWACNHRHEIVNVNSQVRLIFNQKFVNCNSYVFGQFDPKPLGSKWNIYSTPSEIVLCSFLPPYLLTPLIPKTQI